MNLICGTEEKMDYLGNRSSENSQMVNLRWLLPLTAGTSFTLAYQSETALILEKHFLREGFSLNNHFMFGLSANV